MNYGSCKSCGKGIRYDKLSLCKDCEAKYLHLVKDYIYENGVKTVNEIHLATGVPINVIGYFLKNGYFTSVNSAEAILDSVANEEQEKIQKQMALLDALKDAFSENENKKEEEFAKGEMRFMNRNR